MTSNLKDIYYKSRRFFFRKIISKKIVQNTFSFNKYLNSIEDEPIKNVEPSICVSWDDFCKPRISVPFDYGQFEGEESAWNKFVNFTKINIDLTQFIFYIPKPSFSYFSEYSTLDNNYSNCSDFICAKKKYIEKYTNSIIFGIHGIYHNRRYPIDLRSSMEFEFMSYSEVISLFNKNSDIFINQLGDTHFKPPAWSLGQLDGKFNALNAFLSLDNKISYIHVLSPSTSQLEPLKNISKIHACYINKMISIPQNINILWSRDQIKKIIDLIVSKGGIVNPQIHFISGCKYINDGISERNLETLQWIIDYSRQNGCRNLCLTNNKR